MQACLAAMEAGFASAVALLSKSEDFIECDFHNFKGWRRSWLPSECLLMLFQEFREQLELSDAFL
jgi:hypothetical protein